MKYAAALRVIAIGVHWSDAIGYAGWAAAAITVAFYIRLKMSDPVSRLQRAIDEGRRLTASLADERQQNKDLKLMNERLREEASKLHTEHLSLLGKFSELTKKNEEMAERMKRLEADLRRERETRDEQFGQLIRERMKHGDL